MDTFEIITDAISGVYDSAELDGISVSTVKMIENGNNRQVAEFTLGGTKYRLSIEVA